jgi:SulP family sulfate permease
MLMGTDVRTVGDMGQFPADLPTFLLPNIPLTWETFMLLLPYSATLAAVGLLESMMTAIIVDDMTDTQSSKNRECSGQGIANIIAGCFGGMAGCAMIGQSVINVSSGGRGRLSTLCAGVFLLLLILLFGDFVVQIPMPALVAVMVMVSIGTFNWTSLKTLVTNPKSSSFVMLATVVVVVSTHDLAKGVLAGVLLSMIFFSMKVEKLIRVRSELRDEGKTRAYLVTGQIFFASSQAFSQQFDFNEGVKRVIIDFTHSHFWDISAIGALDKVVLKFRKAGVIVELIGLNEASATMIERLADHNKPGAMERALQH